jgi:hypothetical protein
MSCRIVGHSVRVLYPGYRRPPVTAQQIWIWPCFIQWKVVGEPRTPFRIWSQRSWMKGRDHQPKRTKPRHDPQLSFHPPLNGRGWGGQDLTTYKPDLLSSSWLDSAHARAPKSHTWWSPVPGKWPKSRDPRAARPFNATQDKTTTGTHTDLAGSTQVLESVPSPPTIATPPQRYA